MTERTALMAAVLAEPDEDLVRLVLADWFEEHGDPERAAYVRASVELARAFAFEGPGGPGFRAAAATVSAVPPRALWEWAGGDGLPVGEGPPRFGRSLDDATDWVWDLETAHSFGFRRGFVTEVRLPAATWERQGPGVVAAAPVEAASLAGRSPYRFREGEWVWRLDGAAIGGPGCTLPTWAFDRLDGRAVTLAVYPTREAAEGVLSAAVLAYCRGGPTW